MAVCVAMTLAFALGAGADVFYVHAERGDDARTSVEAGHAATPWRTLERVAAELSDGDTVYGAGTFEGRLVNSEPLSGVRILQWPGETAFVVRGSRAVMPEAWARHDGDCFRTVVVGNPEVRGVVVLFNDPMSRDEYGRHRGWLAPVDSPEECAVTEFTYHWDGDRYLYINVGGADPARDPRYQRFPVEYALGGFPHAEGLIDLVRLEDSEIRGVTFRMLVHKGDGAYFLGIGGMDNLVEACVFEHCAWHALVVGRYGALAKRNTVRGCVFKGFGDASGTPHPNFLTFYSAIEDVEGNVEEDNTYLCYSMLGCDGVPLDPAFEVHATYCHTSGQGITVRNHERRRLVIRHFENPGSAMKCSNTPAEMPQGGREWDPASYEVRHTDCVVYGGYDASGVANGSFSRCSFFMDNFGPRGGNRGCFGFDAGPMSCLFDACHISVNMYHESAATNVFLMSQPSPLVRPHLLLRNTNIVASDGHPGWGQRVFWWAGSALAGRVSARGCVIGALNDRNIVLAEGAGAARLSQLDLRGNMYFNIGSESWIRGHPLAHSEALFRANVDAPIEAGGDAVYAVDPGFVGDGPAPAPGGVLAVTRRYQTNASAAGINGEAYAGRYGAWQDQPCDADFNRDGLVGSQDVFAFLYAFFEQHVSADFDRDGAVGSQDLLAYLSAFFAGCE